MEFLKTYIQQEAISVSSLSSKTKNQKNGSVVELIQLVKGAKKMQSQNFLMAGDAGKQTASMRKNSKFVINACLLTS